MRTERGVRGGRETRSDRVITRDRGVYSERGARSRDGGRDVRRRGVRFYWGPGAEFYYWNGYYYGNCQWLRRRALATGSQYWWSRYRRCRSWNG
jgi:hypothetical protein